MSAKRATRRDGAKPIAVPTRCGGSAVLRGGGYTAKPTQPRIATPAEAAGIVVSEIDTLERRVRAFSEFSREPPVVPEILDVNALVTERLSLLGPAHPDTTYTLDVDERGPRAHAGADLVKGILTNLLENAAEAAGPGGRVQTVTRVREDQVEIEVHDSGPGVSQEASRTLFEPTITFKKHGMGLGLSIARKNALISGGDLTLVDGALGGAGFRVVLPAADEVDA